MKLFHLNRLVRVVAPLWAPLWLLLGCAAETAAVKTPAKADSASNPLYRALDDTEVTVARATVQSTLEGAPSHSTRRWRGVSAGISGAVTPRRTFKIKTGHYCREFDESVTLDGKVTSERRTACRTGDGRWLVVER